MRGRIQSFRAENGISVIRNVNDVWQFIESEASRSEFYRFFRVKLGDLQKFLLHCQAGHYFTRGDGLSKVVNLDYALRWRADQFVKEFMAYGKNRAAVSYGHDIGKQGPAPQGPKARSVRK